MTPPRRTAVVLRHVAFEDLGLLAPILDEAGWNACYCDAPIEALNDPSIAAADLLVVLGGPIGVYDLQAFPFLAREISLLEHRLAKDRPTLGICLGSQLIARALGARVFAGPVKEIGWGCVTLTSEGRASCLAPLADDGAAVLHWHGDTFDLPQDVTLLASTTCYDNQAFSRQPHPGAPVPPRSRRARAGSVVCRPRRGACRGRRVSRGPQGDNDGPRPAAA